MMKWCRLDLSEMNFGKIRGTRDHQFSDRKYIPSTGKMGQLSLMTAYVHETNISEASIHADHFTIYLLNVVYQLQCPCLS